MGQRQKVNNVIEKLDRINPKDFSKETRGFGEFVAFKTNIEGRDVTLQYTLNDARSMNGTFSIRIEDRLVSDDEYPRIREVFERVRKKYDKHT